MPALLLAVLLIAGDCRGNGLESRDNNVWAYSELFVKRFGMDPANVTNGLRGAQAVAIRLVPLMRQRCHRTEQGERCVPSWQWLMDLYIDLDQYIGIQGVSPRQFLPWRSSLYFLGQRNPDLQQRWRGWFGLKDARLYLRGPDGEKHRLYFEVFSYKRPIKRGLQIVRARIDERVLLAGQEQERIIEFRDPDGRVVHQVVLPREYWPRTWEHMRLYPGLGPVNWRDGIEKDPHIWIYTREFARRYHMPPANISDEMEGAMALAFRKDSLGTTYCDSFVNQDVCVFHRKNLWDLYLPHTAKLYFDDERVEKIDNFSEGFHPSDTFLHECLDHSDWDGTLPDLIQGKSIMSWAHIVRYRKRGLLNWLHRSEMTDWLGGGSFNYCYLNATVLHDFTFVESSDIRLDVGIEQYFVFDNVYANNYQYLPSSNFHKVKIPVDFMKAAAAYAKKFDADHCSYEQLVGVDVSIRNK